VLTVGKDKAPYLKNPNSWLKTKGGNFYQKGLPKDMSRKGVRTRETQDRSPWKKIKWEKANFLE